MKIVPSEYPYAGYSLSPSQFAEVILLSCSGRELRRSDLIDAVNTYHVQHGGLPAATNIISTVKRALQYLVERDLAEPSVAHGHWRIGDQQDVASAAVEPAKGVETSEYVYVYFLPAYEELAAARNSATWPHKIGMTVVDVETRIAQQVTTGLPERPVVATTFKTDNAAALERAIHAVLHARGKACLGAMGQEWFETNVAEVEQIIEFCQMSS